MNKGICVEASTRHTYYYCLIHFFCEIDELTIAQARMIDDGQLALTCNILGVTIFFLIIVYHYVTVDLKQD
jgi:hypothetical protein